MAFLDDALTPKALQVLTDHFLEALAHRDFLQVKFMSIQPRITHAHLKFNIVSEKSPKPKRNVISQPPFFQGLMLNFRDVIIPSHSISSLMPHCVTFLLHDRWPGNSLVYSNGWRILPQSSFVGWPSCVDAQLTPI